MINLKIPDKEELKYIATKFFIWGFLHASDFINPNIVEEKDLIEAVDWQWNHKRNKPWGLPQDNEEVYEKLNDL